MRHPLLVAKQATSVAVLTGNRLALGVGTSPWPEDYQLCDVPWEGRGRRMDEAVDIVRGLSAGGYFEYHGEVYDLPSVKISPTPTEPLPILIGGHAPAALRRAARSDGWLHGGRRPRRSARTARAPGSAARGGGDGGPALRGARDLHSTPTRVDGIRRLEEQGVTDVIVGFRWPYAVGPDTEALQTKVDNLRRFADDVMAKVRAMITARELGRASMAAVEARDRSGLAGPVRATTPWSRTRSVPRRSIPRATATGASRPSPRSTTT